MRDNRDSIDFGKTNIRTLFSNLFFPTLLGMLFNMAFILTDGIFVGHGIGGNGLAAINLVGPIMMLINGLGMMFGIGASVVAAIHLSQHNQKAARINVTQAFIAGFATSILIGTVCYLFPGPILSMLGASGNLLPFAREYYLWFIPTCLVMMIETIGLFIIRLDGSPVYAMMSNIIPAVVNIILDYTFIFPCQWGLMGASLATDIGGLIGAAMVMYYMLFRTKTLKFYRLKTTRTSAKLMLRNIGYMIKMGNSGLIGEIAVAVMMLIGNLQFIHYVGDDGVAAYSVACYLFPLVYMFYNAIAQSAQPIISYNHGAKNASRVGKTLKFSLLIASVAGCAIALVFFFFAPTIISIFLPDTAPAHSIVAQGLPLYASAFLFMAINICCVGYYQSIEKGGAASVFTILRGIVFLTIAFFVLPPLIGVNGLWLALPAAEVLTTATIIFYGIAQHRKTAIR